MAQLNSDTNGLWAQQDKDAFLDYSIDWADWLALSPGDTINTSTWSTDPALTLTSPGVVGSVSTVWVQGGVAWTWYAITNTVVSNQGRRDQRTIRIQVVDEAVSSSSALFPNRALTIAKMRRDRLTLLAASIMPDVQVSDDYLWDKLLAAEASISHQLRVPLAPTRFFAADPSQAQIDALNGQPWAVDAPYDYNPADWYGDKWGYIVTRQKPLQSVIGMKFVYPSPAQTIVDVPADWIRMDKKYGHIQIVPTGTAYQTLLGGLFMSNLSGGRTLPFTVHLDYVAGLANVAREFPDLLDAVQKLAVTKLVEDGFMPQSGSVSADGLSQSLSVDVGKYHDVVDGIINGTGSNGGLVARIHGIRAMVM